MIESLMLVTALSIDTFITSFAYGANKIKIPAISVGVISFIISAILLVSLIISSFTRQFIPAQIANIMCFSVLLLLGIGRFFEGVLKNCILKSKSAEYNMEFKMFNLNFMLSVYADGTKADIDHSNILSPFEGIYLALALSFDGLAAGFGSGLTGINYIQVIGLSVLVNAVAVVAGAWLGDKIAKKVNLDLLWLSGLMLIVLAVMKII